MKRIGVLFLVLVLLTTSSCSVYRRNMAHSISGSLKMRTKLSNGEIYHCDYKGDCYMDGEKITKSNIEDKAVLREVRAYHLGRSCHNPMSAILFSMIKGIPYIAAKDPVNKHVDEQDEDINVSQIDDGSINQKD